MVTGTPHLGDWLVPLSMALICDIATSSLTSPWPLLVVNGIHAAGLPLSCSHRCIGRMSCVLHTLYILCVVLFASMLSMVFFADTNGRQAASV